VILDDAWSLDLNNRLIQLILPVNDMIRVTVVYTLENLFYEYSCILLGEFPSCNDLIEELSTLADS
jgi:hypothetical protein